MKLIDADKLIAKIENIRQAFINKGEQKDLHNAEIVRRSIIYSCNDFLAIITSLQQEQPEVSLEEEVKRWKDKHGVVGMEDLWLDFARHFWNRGYNAAKEK